MRLPILLAALPPVLLAACASAPSQPAVTALLDRLPEADPAEAAARIDRHCPADPVRRLACREEVLTVLTRERGIGPAMAVLARLAATDGEGHVLTHAIGITGYHREGEVGPAFEACTPIYQSGCQHGVIQAHLAGPAWTEAAGEEAAEALRRVCAPYEGESGAGWQLFQCLHGLGHGLMAVHANDLPRALAGCDVLAWGWAREACYGGAFMENVMTVVAGHHSHVGVGRPGDDDPHDGAGHAADDPHAHHADPHAHGPAPREPFRAVDPDDLHHPCSVVEERYQIACYGMQTSLILHQVGGDVGAAAAACREAPDATLRTFCHRSLGRDINAITDGAHQRSLRLCARVAPEDRASCHIGVVDNVIAVSADAATGLEYCALLPEGRDAFLCYRAVGQQAGLLLGEPGPVRAFCERVPGEHRGACLEGARVEEGGR